jgi:hypothetical protein
MGLDQHLADFKAEFMRTAPAGRPPLRGMLRCGCKPPVTVHVVVACHTGLYGPAGPVG